MGRAFSNTLREPFSGLSIQKNSWEDLSPTPLLKGEGLRLKNFLLLHLL
jgi:hypothetical protein